MLGLHPVTVRRMIGDGRLPGVRLGARWYTTPGAVRELLARAGGRSATAR
jgi:hypothetical protein